MNEFELIRRFFARPAPSALLGIGDDCALIAPRPGQVLAVSADMLVSGRHFLPDVDPEALGHKALAVNLSDLAAMGAEPRWVMLSLALPEADPRWLERFAAGLFALAGRHGVELIGGDTTRGPLNLSLQIFGEVPADQALRRSAAQVGDQIWISGTLGDAALGLDLLRGTRPAAPAERDYCVGRLERPTPRVELGLALRGIAHAAIDLSDGLGGDLKHILAASGVGAELDTGRLPLSSALRAVVSDPAERWKYAMCGGDDYELCFTAPPDRTPEIAGLAQRLRLPLTAVGRIVAGDGLRVLDAAGAPVEVAGGFDHFR